MENISLLTAPPLSQDGFGELLEQREAAGYQRDKRRGTFQSTTLNKIVTRAILEDEKLEELDEQGGKLSQWLEEAYDSACGPEGTKINAFLNINQGKTAASPGAGENEGWHTDNPTDPDNNTGRSIFYHMVRGKLASLQVRRDNVEAERARFKPPLLPHDFQTRLRLQAQAQAAGAGCRLQAQAQAQAQVQAQAQAQAQAKAQAKAKAAGSGSGSGLG